MSLPKLKTGGTVSVTMILSLALHPAPLLTWHQYNPLLVMLILFEVLPVFHWYVVKEGFTVNTYGLAVQTIVSAPKLKVVTGLDVMMMLSLDEQPFTVACNQ